MPKGQAAMSWTPEQDAKLLLTILSTSGVQVDYKKVAEAFGKWIYLDQASSFLEVSGTYKKLTYLYRCGCASFLHPNEDQEPA